MSTISHGAFSFGQARRRYEPRKTTLIGEGSSTWEMMMVKRIQLFNKSLVAGKQPFKIECIDVLRDEVGEYLVVGSADGQLVVFEREGGEAKMIRKRQVSKRPIVRVSVMRGKKKIVALSDGSVSVYKFEDLVLEWSSEEAKNALWYDVCEFDGGVVRLAVAQKGKDVLWFEGIKGRDGCFELVSSLTSIRGVKMVKWVPGELERGGGGKLLIGADDKYWELDAGTGEKRLIMSLKRGATPNMVALWNGEYMLSMGRKIVPIQGKEPSWEGAVELSEYAIRLSLSYPYLVALTSRSCEMRCLFSRIRLMQSFVIERARCLATSASVGEEWESSKLRCGGAVYVASKRQIWVLSPCPATDQLEWLMEASRYEEATLLCRCLSRLDLPNRDSLLSKVRTQQAFRWFREGQYTRSLQVLSTLKTNALVVLGMYPRYRWRWNREEEESLLPEKWWHATRSMDYERASNMSNVTELDRSVRELIGYLWEERHRWHDETVTTVKEENQEVPLESTDEHVRSFLSFNRAGTALSVDFEKISWNDTSDLPTIVDTVLLQILLHLDEGEQLFWLLGSDNHCHLERSADLLMRLSKYRELLILYRRRGKHETALKWIKRRFDQSIDQSSRPIVDDNSLTSTHAKSLPVVDYQPTAIDCPFAHCQSNPTLFELDEWKSTLAALKSGDKFDPVAAMIAYLSTLTCHHLQLIFDYSLDLLHLYPREALRIFTAKRFPPSMDLPLVSVLEYLKLRQKALEEQTRVSSTKSLNDKYQKRLLNNQSNSEAHSGHDESAKANLVRGYLEEMVFNNGDQTLELHEELLNLYLEPLLSSAIGPSTWENSRDQKCLLKLFEISRALRPEYILSDYPLTEYSLYREKAALLAKLGEHKAVLKECIFKLRSLQEAETYCEKVAAESHELSFQISSISYNVDAPAHTTIFCQFLELLLQPPSQEEDETSHQMRLSYAWTLLEKYHHRFPLQRTFNTLPADIPLQRVQAYLELALKDMIQLQRHTNVLLNMEQSNAIRATIAHKQLQARYINIDENTNCRKCRKKIGLSVFIYILGNEDIVHYQCYKIEKNHAEKDQTSNSQSADVPSL